jgi:type IV pilus assembly protein PilA
MKKLNKKGFTLIELMIVLAIIAILAVVLVPKAGQMKDNARNAGVTTNVNAIRGVLEAKVVDTNYVGKSAQTKTLLINTFKGENALTNPFNTKGIAVDPNASFGYFATMYTAPTFATDSIVVCSIATAVPTLATLTTSTLTTVLTTKYPNNKGIVYVYVYTDGYAVFGIDSTITATNIAIIK